MVDKSVMMILQYFAIGILFVEYLFVSMQKPSELQKHAISLTLSTMIMFIGYCIELEADSLGVALTGAGVSYIGKPFVMLSSMLFISSFYQKSLPKKAVFVLSLLCSSFAILVFSNSYHHLYYGTTGFNPDAPFSPLTITRGSLYYSYVIFAVGYFLSCLYIIIKGSVGLKDKQSRRFNVYIVVMVLAGIGGYVVYLTGATGSYDSTMMGVFVGVICLLILFVRCRIFDAVALGKDQALDDSTNGLVIFDYAGRLSYQNPIVSKYLGKDITLDFLRNLKEPVYKHVSRDKAYIITSKPLYVNRSYVGTAIEITDISDLHNYQSRLEHDVRERTERLATMQREVISSVASIIEARSVETGEHIARTSGYSTMIAQSMQQMHLHNDVIDEAFIDLIGAAAPLHDIGKISVPDHILLKPGPLTETERAIMTNHANSGALIIENSMRGVESDDYVLMAKEIAQYHHERWDGNGYPMGLKGDKIPLSARIVAVADCFDALTSKRCYKDAISGQAAFDIIMSERGTHFDPDVVDAFAAAIKSSLHKIG